MKNDSTPKDEIIECSCGECYKKSYHGVVCPNCAKVNKPVVDSTPKEDDRMNEIVEEANRAYETPSEGWDLESLIAQEIGYISGIFMSQGNTKAKDIIMPTEELKEVADRINLYCFKEIAKARHQERKEFIEKLFDNIVFSKDQARRIKELEENK